MGVNGVHPGGMDSNSVKDSDIGGVVCIGGGVGCIRGGVGCIGGGVRRI